MSDPGQHKLIVSTKGAASVLAFDNANLLCCSQTVWTVQAALERAQKTNSELSGSLADEQASKVLYSLKSKVIPWFLPDLHAR